MNEIIMNSTLFFFKINHKVRKSKKSFIKERYVVLSDVYFLLFDPVPESKNCGRLLFWGDIRQISNAKKGKPMEYLYIEWKEEDDEKAFVSFEIDPVIDPISKFLDRAHIKINKLKDNFKIFQDDINKPSFEDEPNVMSLDKINMLIKYKEELLNKQYSVNTVKELMNLYQKAVEILSANNDFSFKIYLEKLHKMLQNEKFEPEEKNTKQQTNTELNFQKR